ncbi:MAG: 4-demethylwyosine synthase TYW1 [Candidatus Woesearchaeota archaeon]
MSTDEAIKNKLKNQSYGLFGVASSVKVCEWQKKDLRGQGACYKNKFYGVPTHQCIQLSTTLNHCDNKCTYCWRDMASTKGEVMTLFDEPDLIVEMAPKLQQKMLTGFGGNEKVPKEKWIETRVAKHYAISLTGEPTLYPKLKELIELIKKKHCSTFVVTNGLHPEVLCEIDPTQLYVSLDSTNKEDFYKITRCSLKDGWERLLKTLDFIRSIPNKRTVFRITLIKPDNMKKSDIVGFADMIKRGMPKFVEFKSYMYIGSSQERLLVSNQPYFEEIEQFAKEVGDLCDYVIIDEHEQSKVILLVHKDNVGMKDRFIDYEKI